MKTTVQNVHVSPAGGNRVALCWEANGARFHIWINSITREFDLSIGTHRRSGKETLFKNCIDTQLNRGNPGYFPTRYLDPQSPANAKMIAEAMAQFDTEYPKAMKAVQVELELEAKAMAEAKKRRRMEQNAAEAFAALNKFDQAMTAGENLSTAWADCRIVLAKVQS